MTTLTEEEKAKIVNYAITGETTDYEDLSNFINRLCSYDGVKAREILIFLKRTSESTFKLYCEACFLLKTPVKKRAITYKI